MEENPPQVCGPQVSESSGPSDADQASLHSDVQPRGSVAKLSAPPLGSGPSRVFSQEGANAGSRVSWQDDGDYVSLRDKVSLQSEMLDHSHWLSLKSLTHRATKNQADQAESERSLPMSTLTHTPHRAYWREQQNRLPLPLMELMENEALEILTKVLKTYRSRIGRKHFLTKELQRYIEGLKRRRNKRLHCTAQ